MLCAGIYPNLYKNILLHGKIADAVRSLELAAEKMTIYTDERQDVCACGEVKKYGSGVAFRMREYYLTYILFLIFRRVDMRIPRHFLVIGGREPGSGFEISIERLPATEA